MHKHSSHCTRGLTLQERFDHYSGERPENACWPWSGSLSYEGYGVLGFEGGQLRAHRVSYELYVGPIEDDLTIDHVVERGCTIRHCVNPAHLEGVTSGVNALRGAGPLAQNLRKTQCKRGHAFTPENTYIRRTSSGTGRGCVECRRAGDRERYAEAARASGRAVKRYEPRGSSAPASQ